MLATSCPLWGGLWSSSPEGQGSREGKAAPTHCSISVFEQSERLYPCIPQTRIYCWIGFGCGRKREPKNRITVFALSNWAKEVPFTEMINTTEGADLGEKRQDFSFGRVKFEMIIRQTPK